MSEIIHDLELDGEHYGLTAGEASKLRAQYLIRVDTEVVQYKRSDPSLSQADIEFCIGREL